METLITLLILVIVVIAILYIISIWIYKRSPTNMAFIRTGASGTKVCIGRGALVLPVFHEVTWVSLETIKLIVRRARDDAVLTSDKIRIDVAAELYTHVGHNEEDVLTASRSLGEKTFDAEKVRNLLEAKIISAIRSYAATKTLSELHENRDAFAQSIKESVTTSFRANGLVLEEVTIVTLEQTGKEYFNTDNVFDAEGLKIITEITSDARRKVHETEKRTTVSIRQKDLDTHLELLEIEKQEAFAQAGQDKDVANEQALRVGEKQMYILDQRMAVEQKEIDNETALERSRTERDITLTEEAKKREVSEIQKALTLEQEKRDREIALIAKAKEEELAKIQRNLALEQAERDKEITLESKQRERQQAEIERVTAIMAQEELARDERHKASEATTLAMQQRGLETKLSLLDVEKQEAFASVRNEQEISDEQARVLSEKQRFILEQRWHVEQEEINKDLALERARIQKDIAVTEENRKREAADIQRALAREQEERDRQIALVAKDEQLERARIQQNLSVELDQRSREITLINKEQEREQADIRRFLAREQEERDREIAIAAKTAELEHAEADRLQASAQREEAEQNVNAVRLLAQAERQKKVDRIEAEARADSQRIGEENQAQISRMHLLTEAEARQQASEREADATLIRAKANSEAQQIAALGIEKQAAAKGRAEMEVEQLRVANTQRMLEAEAVGIEAKADALKKYNDAATFLELAQLHIEAERDIHIDQAKAMGNALQNAQIRMYGGGGSGGDGDGTVDTIRGLFTTGFGLGEVLEGVAQSLPEGLRERFAENGIRGIFGRPGGAGQFRAAVDALTQLVDRSFENREARENTTFKDGLLLLEEQAQTDTARSAVGMLKSFNQQAQSTFDDVAFEKVWALLQSAVKSVD